MTRMARSARPVGPVFDPGLQNERTRLAWQRTSLSLTTTGLIASRLLAVDHLAAAVAMAALTLAAWIWVTLSLRSRYRTSHAALVAGRPLPGGQAHVAMSALVVLVGLTSLGFLLSRP